jgi:8-oxo-dGTP pyrophosphatase MutT (NUDIX family)
VSDLLRPSATVAVLRDGRGGLEVLLLERTARGDGVGSWVFPGGGVEAEDRSGEEGSALEDALRAALRETREEAGLALGRDALLPIARWITPPVVPKRFDAWFFVAAVSPESDVRVDGSEISSHAWYAPAAALDAHHRRAIRLAPPTWVTISWLSAYPTADEALRALAAEPVLEFEPRVCRVPDGMCMLYPGDAGYEDADPERAGPRHRLWARPDGWRYERSGRT